MQDNQIKFEDLKIISVLEETHNCTTKVYLAKKDHQLVVCKSIQKEYFDDAKKVEHLQNEKEALEHFTKVKASNINNLICTFKDQRNIYFLLKPALGLPLHKLMKMADTFNQSFVSLIVTQIAVILQQFHGAGFIYRDIKASNFVIDHDGRVVMIDLGKAKKTNGERTLTMCGTLHAIPPEVLSAHGKHPYSYQFDHYGFGILLYELLIGKAPFGYQKSNPNLADDVQNGLMPQHLQPIKDDFTADLVTKLLNPAEHRLGRSGGFKQILDHPYFRKLDMDSIKLIMQGGQGQLALKFGFKEYQSQIEDFGIEDGRYEQIQPDDPFYGF